MSTDTTRERQLVAAAALSARIARVHSQDAKRAFAAFVADSGALEAQVPIEFLLVLWGGYIGHIVAHMSATLGLHPSVIVKQLEETVRELGGTSNAH